MQRMRILIVGGVAAGASAATRARRMNEQAEIIVFEKGEYVSFANCGLPYHISGRIADRAKLLVSNPREFAEKFRIETRTRNEVLKIDRTAGEILVRDLRDGREYRERYDRLILAPGASPVVPPWPGVKSENVFTLRDLADMDAIKARLDHHKPSRAAVVGGGFIGLEMVEALHDRGVHATVVEQQPHVLPPFDADMAAEIETELHQNGVDVLTGATVTALEVQQGRVTALNLQDGRSIPTELVIVSVGVRPNTRLAVDAGLTIGPAGGIAVNAFGQTSDPRIYAAGDAAEVVHVMGGKPARVPLAGPANRNGRIAGQHAATGHAPEAAPVAGTAIVGVMGQAAAITGLSLGAARKAGYDAAAAYALRAHHASYYPGAESMILKLVYDRATRRVLGAQAVGRVGVDKRIDVVATTLHFGGTIDDLAGLDLAYAPQFGSAKDPLHIAAFVAINEADGLVRQVAPGEDVPPGQLVDVRSEAEYAGGTLDGARNIPLPRLRDDLELLDRSQPVVVFCQVGQRGYNAARILSQSGFSHVVNLAGGYRLHAKRNGD